MPRFIVWFWDTVTVAVQKLIPFSFCSQAIGVAVPQSGAGDGAGGLQQSVTICPSPHGTAPVMPAGTGKTDESKLYIRAGRSNLISATFEENSPQIKIPSVDCVYSEDKRRLRMDR